MTCSAHRDDLRKKTYHSCHRLPPFSLVGNIAQCDLISDTEAESFLRACKPELDDFPRLVAALGAHLAPTFRESKMEAIRRAQEVSQSMRRKLANFLWSPACLAAAGLVKIFVTLALRGCFIRSFLFAPAYSCVWK